MTGKEPGGTTISRKLSTAKKLYKAWVRSKREEDYIKYRLARCLCKGLRRKQKKSLGKSMESNLVSCADIHHHQRQKEVV